MWNGLLPCTHRPLMYRIKPLKRLLESHHSDFTNLHAVKIYTLALDVLLIRIQLAACRNRLTFTNVQI